VSAQQFITLYPELTPSDDGRFACLSLTLPDGRYICVTNMGGMGYPSADDYMVCVYRNERELGEQSLGCFTSDKFDIEDALNTATWLTMGDLGEVQS
jgi:hypothetical protein